MSGTGDTGSTGGAGGMGAYLWGPLSRSGLLVAAVIAVLDQASKLWILFVFDLPSRGRVAVAPFVDFVMAWNRGISYGWFQLEGPAGPWILVTVTALAVALLWVWLARERSYLAAVSIGLIIGGAIGNGIDRVLYGAVADFVLIHAYSGSWSFDWYVFNLADIAIVAGVAGLLYDFADRGSRRKSALIRGHRFEPPEPRPRRWSWPDGLWAEGLRVVFGGRGQWNPKRDRMTHETVLEAEAGLEATPRRMAAGRPHGLWRSRDCRRLGSGGQGPARRRER